MEDQLITYLESYNSIHEKDQILIKDVFVTRLFKEGDYLFYPNNVCKELFFICNGAAKITVQKEKGNVVTNFFFKENQFCTILKSFTNQTGAIEGIQAASDLEALVISREKLLFLYEKAPSLKIIIEQIIQKAVLDKVELRNSYLGLDSASRYKLFMKQQSEVSKLVSLSSVASYLGITQQSLSRIRKNLS